MLIRMQNISISKSDWDAQENELVRLSKEYWTEQFLRLHANEAELIEELREPY